MEEQKIQCTKCDDTGYVTITKWVGDDTSYDEEEKCACGIADD